MRRPAERDKASPRLGISDYERGPKYSEGDLLDLHLGAYFDVQNRLDASFRAEPVAYRSRFLFFSGIRTFVRTVIKDLDASAFELYQRLPFALEETKTELVSRTHKPNWFEIEVGTPFETVEERFARLGDDIFSLYSELIRWSRRNNLDHAWCRQQAYNTLCLWNKDQELHNDHQCLSLPELPLPSTLGSSPPGLERSQTYELRIGLPSEIRRSEERREQIKLFGEWLDELLAEREKSAESLGFVRSKEKFAESSHFDWLAYYQCDPSIPSFVQTGEKFGVSREGAEGAIKEAAEICGLILRAPSKGGRPKK